MKIIKAIILLGLFFSACKEPYDPEVNESMKDLLVVEGYINTGGGPTSIRLTRTVHLNHQLNTIGEIGATLRVEGENGSAVQGTTNNKGVCVLATNNLNQTQKYRLVIKTKSGKSYTTDFLENKKAPEIRNLDFKQLGSKLQLYLNTEDPTNNTRYYGWTFDETWEFVSSFSSAFEYKNGELNQRDQNINISHCWQSSQSKEILVGSSAKLAADKIAQFPINSIMGNSIKISTLYSINVSQYGLTQDAYDYLVKMKKNTEQIGSIFDPQPSELKGNIRCISDPSEVVIGFISSGSIKEKRFFISPQDLSKSSNDWHYKSGCTIENSPPDSLAYFTNTGYLIIDEYRTPLGGLRYMIANSYCIDCRLSGTNVKPSYWPN